jgi:hypothetical protein
MTSKFDARRTLPELQHEFCNLWNRLVFTARNDDDYDTRSITVRKLKRDRHAPNLAMIILRSIRLPQQYSQPYFNSYTTLPGTFLPRGDCENHRRHHSNSRHLPRATSGPRVYPLSLYPGHLSQSPQATAVPLNSPLIQPPISLTPVPALAAHKLPSPSHPAPTPSAVHHTSQHASSDSIKISSGSAHFGCVSVYPTATSSVPAPQKTSVPAPAMTARSMDLPAPADSMSGLDQPKPSGSHIQ